MNIEEQLAKIDRSLGIRRPDPELVHDFRDAGFDTSDAERGALLMESGRYFSFTDVATSLATSHGPGGAQPPSEVWRSKIAEVAASREERAATKNAKRTSPYGRPPVAESGKRSPWGTPLDVVEPKATATPRAPIAEDFREVGLSEVDAVAAVAGLRSGRYVSFEDACHSVALLGRTSPVPIKESVMRTKAKQFARLDGK